MISFLILFICISIGALVGFFGPFLIAQSDENPAWGFVPMITIPVGMGIGLVIGIIIIILKYFC
ncbi:MAG TPA: hypothetical protein PLG41_18380 [Leptospiraceae bacterium]|nr:hypothetical protein [Leptospiraceae bacterium]